MKLDESPEEKIAIQEDFDINTQEGIDRGLGSIVESMEMGVDKNLDEKVDEDNMSEEQSIPCGASTSLSSDGGNQQFPKIQILQ